MKEDFNFNTEYKKTVMNTVENRKMTTESNWNEEATKNGMLRITLGDNRVTVRVLDLISNMMYHASKEKEGRYLSDGLMVKTKERRIISYPFTTRLSKAHHAGETLRCELQIEVPVELMDYEDTTRKHIVHEEKTSGIPIIGAPKGAGQLSTPK